MDDNVVRVYQGGGGFGPAITAQGGSGGGQPIAKPRSRDMLPPPALHEKWLIDLANSVGIKTMDETGEYTGLTHDDIASLLRMSRVYQVTMHELNEKERQIIEYKKSIGRLRWWLVKNTTIPAQDMDDLAVLTTTQNTLETVKSAFQAAWPVVERVWTNAVSVLQAAGIIAKDPTVTPPVSGDITLQDHVSERPK